MPRLVSVPRQSFARGIKFIKTVMWLHSAMPHRFSPACSLAFHPITPNICQIVSWANQACFSSLDGGAGRRQAKRVKGQTWSNSTYPLADLPCWQGQKTY